MSEPKIFINNGSRVITTHAMSATLIEYERVDPFHESNRVPISVPIGTNATVLCTRERMISYSQYLDDVEPILNERSYSDRSTSRRRPTSKTMHVVIPEYNWKHLSPVAVSWSSLAMSLEAMTRVLSRELFRSYDCDSTDYYSVQALLGACEKHSINDFDYTDILMKKKHLAALHQLHSYCTWKQRCIDDQWEEIADCGGEA